MLIYSFVSAALPVAYCLAVLEFSVFSIQQLRKVGVFCHSAITGAEKDQDLLVQSLLQEKETFRERLLQLFKTFDDDGNGIITLFEFETRFQDESVRALFEALELGACGYVYHLLVNLGTSVAAARPGQGPKTKSTHEAGLCGSQLLGGLQLKGAEPGDRQASALWEVCAGKDSGMEQCSSDSTAKFCDLHGGAGFLMGAFVGAGVGQAYCFLLKGFFGGMFGTEIGLRLGGFLSFSAVLLSDYSLEGHYGSQAREHVVLDGKGARGCLNGGVTEEIGVSLAGLPGSFAGFVGNGVLEGYEASLAKEQALPKDQGVTEERYGDPPEPGGGAGRHVHGTLVDWGGQVLEEIVPPRGGLNDGEAGDAGKAVLVDFAAGLAMEQAMYEELGVSEGLGGGPSGPAGGGCGFLHWSWLRPRLQQGLRGARVGEACRDGAFLEEIGLGGLAGPGAAPGGGAWGCLRRRRGKLQGRHGRDEQADLNGKDLEETELITGGPSDGVAGSEGNGVLGDYGAGFVEEQALAEELGAPAGLGGKPPVLGGHAGGPLRWCCLRPRWRRGLLGVRVGEASHPGPGGGAAATEHRRQEYQMQQALVSIIELLMSVVASLAGEDNPVKQQMAGVRSLLGVLRAGQDMAPVEERTQQPPWRQVRFEDEPDTIFQEEGGYRPSGEARAHPRQRTARARASWPARLTARARARLGRARAPKARPMQAVRARRARRSGPRSPSSRSASRARPGCRQRWWPKPGCGLKTGTAPSWTMTPCVLS